MKREDITDDELRMVAENRRKQAFIYAYQRGTADARNILITKSRELISELRKDVNTTSAIMVESRIDAMITLINNLRAEG